MHVKNIEVNQLFHFLKDISISQKTNRDNSTFTHSPISRSKNASVSTGEHYYVFGGRSHLNIPLNDAWRFSYKSKTWHKLDIKLPFLENASAIYNNAEDFIYLFGGTFQHHQSDFDHMLKISLKTLKVMYGWEDEEDLILLNDSSSFNSNNPINNNSNLYNPPSLKGHTMCQVKNRIVIYGGSVDVFGDSDDLWTWNKGSDNGCSWRSVECLNEKGPGKRHGHAATMMNGKMYVYGGKRGCHMLNDFWKFDGEKWVQLKERLVDKKEFMTLVALNQKYIALLLYSSIKKYFHINKSNKKINITSSIISNYSKNTKSCKGHQLDMDVHLYNVKTGSWNKYSKQYGEKVIKTHEKFKSEKKELQYIYKNLGYESSCNELHIEAANALSATNPTVEKYMEEFKFLDGKLNKMKFNRDAVELVELKKISGDEVKYDSSGLIDNTNVLSWKLKFHEALCKMKGTKIDLKGIAQENINEEKSLQIEKYQDKTFIIDSIKDTEDLGNNKKVHLCVSDAETCQMIIFEVFFHS